jgi:hypothetical protein
MEHIRENKMKKIIGLIFLLTVSCASVPSLNMVSLTNQLWSIRLNTEKDENGVQAVDYYELIFDASNVVHMRITTEIYIDDVRQSQDVRYYEAAYELEGDVVFIGSKLELIYKNGFLVWKQGKTNFIFSGTPLNQTPEGTGA